MEKEKEQKEQMMSQKKSKLSAETQKKIEKFAKMLKTLNGYKEQYKRASSKNDKKKIHEKVAGFTHKFLEAKNLQLSMQLRTMPLSKWDNPHNMIRIDGIPLIW